MRNLEPLEIGLMFWATGDAERDIAYVRSFGLRAGQLGFGGDSKLEGMGASWRSSLERHPDFRIETAVCSYAGEDYTDIASVKGTVGLLPASLRAERVARTKEVAAIAAELGIRSVACHIGFLPEDWAEMRDVVREICDDLSQHDQTFALETGQEDADALLAFIADVGQRNLKINFDPANMVLYGTGNPIKALRTLSGHVVSVHCKDGVGPDGIGKLGTERPLGLGEVDFPAFLNVLGEVGYTGILSIEREEPDLDRRNTDIRHAIQFLRINSGTCG